MILTLTLTLPLTSGDVMLGPQFKIVYHSSTNFVPPHEFSDDESEKLMDNSYDNTWPSHFHAGTWDAASQAGYGRRYMHSYLVDTKQEHPVTYGDNDESLLDVSLKKRDERMAREKIQPGLFESIGLMKETFDHAPYEPIPYRNAGEDPGSISYAIPKDVVWEMPESGKPTAPVTYLGQVNKNDGWFDDERDAHLYNKYHEMHGKNMSRLTDMATSTKKEKKTTKNSSKQQKLPGMENF